MITRDRNVSQEDGTITGPGIVKAGSIASDVYLDFDSCRATKIYRPTWYVKALYWLAFQAPFPYKANEQALEAARQRRILAGLLTRAKFGREVVAQVIEIYCTETRCEFVTELVAGSYPMKRQEGRRFLGEVSDLFAEAGLDIWQVWRRNPKALGNLVETPGGQFMIIDLESSLVTPPLPLSHIWNSIKTAQVPSFDDVNFPALRAYADEHSRELRGSLGDEDYARLLEAIERCHESMHAWKDSEPRVWGRSLRWVYRLFSRQTPPHM
ncbi:MAG TPA: hypothetical protein VFZ12_02225 [Dehalococcoidia bacterium]|nr:hypothetical protein [Dehalococcoidia bacterium]